MRHIATSDYHIFIFPTTEEQHAYVDSTSARADLRPAHRLFITTLSTHGVDCYGDCPTCPAHPTPEFSARHSRSGSRMSSCKAFLLQHIARRHSLIYRRS